MAAVTMICSASSFEYFFLSRKTIYHLHTANSVMFLKQIIFGFPEASVNITSSQYLTFNLFLSPCFVWTSLCSSTSSIIVNFRHWMNLCLWLNPSVKNIRIFLLFITYVPFNYGCITAFLIFIKREAFNSSNVAVGFKCC